MKDSDYLREMAANFENPWGVEEIKEHCERLVSIADRLDYLRSSMVDIRAAIRPVIQNAPAILELATPEES